MREYLKELRKEKNLTQQEVADKMGVTAVYYGYIERGEKQHSIDLGLADKLADVFEVSLITILEEERELKLWEQSHI